MSAALRAVWMNKTLWCVHVVANATVVAAMYGWLSIPDRTVIDLVLSAMAALGILLLVSWLHASTLDYFRISHETGAARMWTTFRPSMRRIVVFALWLILLSAAIILVLRLNDRVQPASNWIASALTFRLRRPIHANSISPVLSTGVALAAFLIVPFLLVQFWNRNRRWTHAVIYIALFIVCAYLPYRLIWWVPALSGLNAQSASMVLRFTAAYLLAVTGWLVLASTLGQARR